MGAACHLQPVGVLTYPEDLTLQEIAGVLGLRRVTVAYRRKIFSPASIGTWSQLSTGGRGHEYSSLYTQEGL